MTLNPHFPSLGILAVAGAVCVLVAVLVLRSSQVRGRHLRRFILGLRLTVVVLLAVFLLNPVTRRGIKQDRDRCPAVVLADVSESMSLGNPPRSSVAAEVVSALQAVHLPGSGVLIFPFADQPANVPLEPGGNLPPATGARTLLGRALLSGLDRARSAGAERIVVVSDGRLHDPDALALAIQGAREKDVYVDVLPVGTPPEKPNLAIVNCLVERRVSADSLVPVTVVIHATRAEGNSVVLTLRGSDGQVLDELRCEVTDGTVEKQLQAPVEEKDASFTVELAALPGELSLADNRFEFSVQVSDPRIRVLYMEGSNHRDKRWSDMWEYEFITRALQETGRIDVDVLTVDEQTVEGGKLFSPGDPDTGFPASRERLFTYDVIICSDINRSIFSDEQLQWTVDLVAARGGGFCMIGGYTAFGAGRWDKTVWERLIPVDMKTEKEGYVWEDIPVAIPAAVRTHPIWALDRDAQKNAHILERHPPFLGMNLVNKAKPAATVLARYEKRDVPLICVQTYGRGRSMAFLSDAAGGWGEKYQTEWGEGEKDNRYYRKFWVNTVRWLAENSAARYETELIATSEAVNYRPGDRVPVRAFKRNQPDIEALRGLLVTARLEGFESPTVLRLDETDQTFRGVVLLPEDLPADTAVIHFEARSSDGQPAGDTRTTVRLLHTSRELEDPSPAPEILAQLADLTGGRVLRNTDELTALLRQAEDTTVADEKPFTVPAWDRTWIWAFLVLLLTTEWLTRKWLKLKGE